MALSPNEITKLKKLISLAQELLATVEPTTKRAARATKSGGKRTRRTGKELVAFKKMLKAERRKGSRVEELANKHGVSTAYIYQLGT